MIDFDINKSTYDSHVLDHKTGLQISESPRDVDLLGERFPLMHTIRAGQPVYPPLPGVAALII